MVMDGVSLSEILVKLAMVLGADNSNTRNFNKCENDGGVQDAQLQKASIPTKCRPAVQTRDIPGMRRAYPPQN
jgi:hypothetical protein